MKKIYSSFLLFLVMIPIVLTAQQQSKKQQKEIYRKDFNDFLEPKIATESKKKYAEKSGPIRIESVQPPDAAKKDEQSSEGELILNEYIKREVSEAVLGSNNTTNGLNIDLGKNEVKTTIKFPTKKSILTLDFGAALDEKGMAVFFKDEKLNTKFSTMLNWHIIPQNSWDRNIFSDNDFEIEKAQRDLDKKIKNFNKLESELIAMAILIRYSDSTAYEGTRKVFKNKRGDELESLNDFYKKVEDGKYDNSVMIEMMRKYGKDLKTIDIDRILSGAETAKFDIDKLYNDFNDSIGKITEKIKVINDYSLDRLKQLALGKTSKSWLTLSAGGAAFPINIFDDKKQLDSRGIYNFGLDAIWNRFETNEKVFRLGRLRMAIGRVNNLSDIKEYAYTKALTDYKSDTLSIVWQEKKAAYDKAKVATGLGLNAGYELFWLHKKSRIGFWGTINFNYNEVRKNNFQIPIEVGPIFKLNTQANKTVYLLPYLSFIDLLRPSEKASDLKIFKKDSFIGVKFGLPIWVD